MEKIPYDVILDIQKKVNIVDIIGEYLPLEQRGKNYFAICPFHDDHNPSMSISSEKQIYTCFVCGESGNVFNFIMKYEHISFTEAVVKVANKVGINLNISNFKKENKLDDRYSKYYKLYELVNKFYQNNLKSIYGKSATEYLHKRKITDDIIKEFEIGLSLNDNSISKLLTNKGYSIEQQIEIGICGNKDDYIYDIFRNRIMFPLYDLQGNVVGFSGRIYNGEDENKYVNSKESVIFKKGTLLYNYHRAVEYAREKKQIIIVEGFMDVIRLHSVGIKNVVATMGTAITKEHANLIMKLSKNVILCFDGDKAGEKATLSALQALNDIGLSPKIIRLEEDLDPDDYIIRKGYDKYLNHLNNPISDIEFRLNITKSKTDFNNYNEISNYIKEAVKELEKINDKVVYELTIKRISKETGVDISTISGFIKKDPVNTNIIIKKPFINQGDKYKKAEEYLVYYMLRQPDAILLYQKHVAYLKSKLLSRLAIEILDFYDKNHYINISDFIVFLEDKLELINEALRLDSLDMPDMNVDQIEDYIKTIETGLIKDEIEKLKLKIKEETNIDKKVILLEKLTELKKKEC